MTQMIEWKHEKNFVDYRLLRVMSKRVEDIILHKKKELVWLLEHNNLYTLGTSAKTSDFKNKVSIPKYRTKRGGQTTYHGPGQRIIYLMLDLRNGEKDIKQLVWKIEEWLILVLKDIGIFGYRIPGLIGVWVKDPKNHKCDGTRIKNRSARIESETMGYVSWLVNQCKPRSFIFNNINPCGIQGKV
ncbi:MAG: hypothetical protein CM15mP98_04200 [Paracoccaceae bacterium]|nr:MAG: hypothetical protein CM15mP98_04200 [Paracoccaceae bacterium]